MMFGFAYGSIPYSIKEHVKILEDIIPSLTDRQQVFWQTNERVFRLGLSAVALPRAA